MAASTMPRGNLFFPSYPHQRRPININTRFPGQSLYRYQTGFGTGDVSSSPDTPAYPVAANTYQLPAPSDWLTWGKDPVLTEGQVYPSTFVDSTNDEAIKPLDLSPSINPLDLSTTMPDVASFGQDLFDESSDMFYTTPSPTQEDFRATSQQQKTVDAVSPTMSRASAGSRPSRKRKSSSSDYADSSPRSSQSPDPQSAHDHSSAAPRPTRRRSAPGTVPPKKTAHNMVEKRYRTNLNDKIAALRDSVPSLRVMVHRLEHQSSDDGSGAAAADEDAMEQDDEEELGGLTPAHKLNKATILSKATEYITHLERRNKSLAKENAALRSRVETLGGVVAESGDGESRWD